MNIEPYELQKMIQAGQKYAVRAVLVELGLLKAFLTKAQAYRQYGRNDVDRWIKEGLVKPKKDGDNSAKVSINRLEIEAVSLASNRGTYLTVAERKQA